MSSHCLSFTGTESRVCKFRCGSNLGEGGSEMFGMYSISPSQYNLLINNCILVQTVGSKLRRKLFVTLNSRCRVDREMFECIPYIYRLTVGINSLMMF